MKVDKWSEFTLLILIMFSSCTYSFNLWISPHFLVGKVVVSKRDDSRSCTKLLNAPVGKEEEREHDHFDGDGNNLRKEEKYCMKNRRDALYRISILSQGLLVLAGNPYNSASADETRDLTTFESIAERASQLSPKAITTVSTDQIKQSSESTTETMALNKKSIYDFEVPVSGKLVPVRDLVTREINGEKKQPKAILVVNIKQDDPIARKNMPQLISLGSRFGKTGDFVVISIPTDQGYFEPDTSALIRLKLAAEYGYGINPGMQLTDKMNLLGNTANPMIRWIQSTCRTPTGLGRIQGNFEKFLVDGQTGQPLRRYPRKYVPFDIADDIEALIDGKPLPPRTTSFLSLVKPLL